MNKYEILEMIDEGAYGIVLKAVQKSDGTLVAIKKFKDSQEDQVAMKAIQRQVKMLRKFKGPFVVELIQAFRRKGSIYLVFQFMQRNVLQLLQLTPDGLSPATIQRVIYKTLKALQFLHRQNVTHRDIKPQNLLVNGMNEEMVLKLCDFGFTRELPVEKGNSMTDYVATRWYRSPQLLVRTSYGLPADIWAVGCIMGQLIDGKPMFAGENQIDQLYLIVKTIGTLTNIQEDYFKKNFKGALFPPIKNRQPLQLKYINMINDVELDFMKGCLMMDPDQRFTVDAALKHPYLASLQKASAKVMRKKSMEDVPISPAPRMSAHIIDMTPKLTGKQSLDAKFSHRNSMNTVYDVPSNAYMNPFGSQANLAQVSPPRRDITHKIQLQVFPPDNLKVTKFDDIVRSMPQLKLIY